MIILTGFLGSGKTSLLLEIAKELARQGKKIAIIENEVGKIGIDDNLIRENGFNVREIYSGCICCSLRMDLVSTLLMLEREHNPEIVILEPSGVAGPKQVLAALLGYGGDIDKKTVVNIVDVSRYRKLEDLSLPIIRDGITTAEIIVLNKTDLVSENDLNELMLKLKKFKETVPFVAVSLLKDKNLDQLISLIVSHFADGGNTGNMDLTSSEKIPEPAVFSKEENIKINPGDFVEKWTELLVLISGKLHKAGAFIGHIKAMFNAGKNGYCVISVTSPDHPPVVKGKLKITQEGIKLRINAIAYNITKIELSNIIENLIQNP